MAFGGLWLTVALLGTVRPRFASLRGYWDSVAVFGNELAWPMAAIAAAVALAALAAGLPQTTAGRVGLVLTLAAIALMALSLLRARHDGEVLERELEAAFGPTYLERIKPERRGLVRARFGFRDWVRPLHIDATGLETLADIAYGPHGAFNTLDILRAPGHVATPLPVLLHIHGGGLVLGRKNQEALPLLHFLARRGWLVVTINYRLSPAARWPAHLEDAKRALAWIREHIGDHGGDPAFVAVTGGSAGGSLAALLALTPGDRTLQPGFEAADTRVQAAVPFYGSYDLGGEGASAHVSQLVMPRDQAADPRLWQEASATYRAYADAPPLLVLHGSHDALAPVQSSRRFVAQLRQVSRAPVVFAEQHGASHGFDAMQSLRNQFVIDAVQRFLECVYGDWSRARGRG